MEIDRFPGKRNAYQGDKHIEATRVIESWPQDEWLTKEMNELVFDDLSTKEKEILVGINNPSLDKEMRKLHGATAVAWYRWKKWNQQLSILLNKKQVVFDWHEYQDTRKGKMAELEHMRGQRKENQEERQEQEAKIEWYRSMLRRLRKVIEILEAGCGNERYKVKEAEVKEEKLSKRQKTRRKRARKIAERQDRVGVQLRGWRV